MKSVSFFKSIQINHPLISVIFGLAELNKFCYSLQNALALFEKAFLNCQLEPYCYAKVDYESKVAEQLMTICSERMSWEEIGILLDSIQEVLSIYQLIIKFKQNIRENKLIEKIPENVKDIKIKLKNIIANMTYQDQFINFTLINEENHFKKCNYLIKEYDLLLKACDTTLQVKLG